MEMPSLNIADRLYSQETVLHFVRFSDSKLEALSSEISRLFRSLDDQKELSIWPIIIPALKKVRFELATIPLPPEKIITDRLMAQLEEALKDSKKSFPDNVEQLSRIMSLLKDFHGQDNPFMRWIKSECMNNNDLDYCLCLLYSKHAHLVENFINADKKLSALKLKVLTPRRLKDVTFYDRIFFCGSIKLFSENRFRNFEFVWRSPRATDLYFLSFNWIRDDFEPKPVFDIKPNKVPVQIQQVSIGNFDEVNEKNDQIRDQVSIDIRDMDFSPVESVLSASSAASSEYYESICECWLLMLEDETFIYREVEKNSRIVVFNPQAEIHKISNNKLEAGMPIVVRTEGSGDSITAVADLLLGDRAYEIRNKQETWKKAFRRKLFAYSTLHEVAGVLTNLGAPTANEINVRNWQRGDTIKPKKYDDFKAIMLFSELDDLTDEYWENARLIDLMHKKAGREISNLLLSRINETSRTDLEKFGRIDVELKGLSGKVSVIRIESIQAEKVEIPYSQLNRVLHY